jgi:ribonuclease HI
VTVLGAGAAAVLVAPSKVKTCYAARLDFSCTNNIAEYEALLLGLRKLKAMGIRRAVLKTDSQVISGHVDKSSKARDLMLEKNTWIQSEDWRLLLKGFL